MIGSGMNLRSDPICHSAGCHKFYTNPEEKIEDLRQHDLGHDKDVVTTFNSLDVAEAMRQHKWILSDNPPKEEEPTKYHTE